MSVEEITFPHQLPIDPDQRSRAVFVHVDQGLFAPHSMRETFKTADETYTRDRAARFVRMASGLLVLPKTGLDASFVHDERDAYGKDLVVVMSPLNDGAPESEPSAITRFIENGDKKNDAKPNSHRPAAKLDADYEFGHGEGMGMPRLQLFAPEAPALTSEQRRRIASGDMSPYGELALEGIEEANRIKREVYGTGNFERIHFFGAGMGAKALGAANFLLKNTDYQQPGAVTLMNFSLGEQSLAKLGRDYSGRRMVGDASQLSLPQDYVRVPEFTVLRELDKQGAEFAMRLRQARAIAHIRMVRAVMNAKNGVDYIENLMANGYTVTVANGSNEAITAQTETYLPVGDDSLHFTNIVGVEGKKVGMAANEHGAALALISNLGIYNHLERTGQDTVRG